MRHMLPLKYFDTVARTGSIRAAADQLAITPSALNRRINAMEDELGVELFERHATGVRLNSAGELFIHHARRQIVDLERVRSGIADLTGLRLGHVRVAATREVGRSCLPRAISTYRQQFPGVTFELQCVDRTGAEQRLVDLSTDIITIFQPQRLADVHTLMNIPQAVWCLVPKNHPLAKQEALRLADCLMHPLILPESGDGVRELIDNAAIRKGLLCQPAVETNDPTVVEDLVSLNCGLAFVCEMEARARADTFIESDPTSSSDGACGVVAKPMLPGEVENGFIFIGQARNRTLPVAVARFVEDLRVLMDE